MINNDLDKILKCWQRKAKRLILDGYYDSVHLSELQYSALRQVTNAKTPKDVNSYLWNSGLIEQTLASISGSIANLKRCERV